MGTMQIFYCWVAVIPLIPNLKRIGEFIDLFQEGRKLRRCKKIGSFGRARRARRASRRGKSRSSPFKGDPGSTSKVKGADGRPKQNRRYGEDGYPETDVDFDHDHDHGPGQPHAHDWGRPEDNGPPTHRNRGPGRPPTSEDPIK